jgi:hypothetical protein
MKAPQKSLKRWTKQKWRTKSGKPSAKTGERYLPEAAIKSLSSAEYAATTKAKREGTKAGKQFVKQPKSVAKKTAKFRAAEGGMAKGKTKCPKCKGAGCSHCGGKGYHTGMNKGGDMGKKPMNEGMKALKKAAPAVAKKMGYMHGGMSKKKGYAAGGLTKSTGKMSTGIRGCGDK